MPRALKKTTPPGPPPATRPRMTRRVRRGVYVLLDLLRSDYALTFRAMQECVRGDYGAARAHDMEAFVDWADQLRRRETAPEPEPRSRASGFIAKPPPPTVKSDPAQAPDLFPREQEPGITSA